MQHAHHVWDAYKIFVWRMWKKRPAVAHMHWYGDNIKTDIRDSSVWGHERLAGCRVHRVWSPRSIKGSLPPVHKCIMLVYPLHQPHRSYRVTHANWTIINWITYERMWPWCDLRYCSTVCVGGTEENHGSSLSRQPASGTEIWTRKLQNTKQEC